MDKQKIETRPGYTKHGRTIEADERRKKVWLKKQAELTRIYALVERDFSALVTEAAGDVGESKDAFIKGAVMDRMQELGYSVDKWL